MVLALQCFGALDSTTRDVSATTPVVPALWASALVQTMPTAASALQLFRGPLLPACRGMAFFSLRVTQVGEFTAIVMPTPLPPMLLVAANAAFHTLTSCMARTEDPGTTHFI
jgi:hypothetical protein